MATWDDVRRIATALPEVTEDESRGLVSWRVKNKLVAWERPLRQSDLKALGNAAPDGPILGAWVPDEGAKEALVADQPDVYFTTPHFNGYAIVLAQLDAIAVDELEELVVEAWLQRAPKRVAKAYLAALDEDE